MYECNPIPFIVSQTRGMSTNGKVDILDIVLQTIYERATIIIGSLENLKECLTFDKN